MRAINHALTGAFIGLTVDSPEIALPVAFLSHYVLDVIPHFGGSADATTQIRSKSFKYLLYADATACFLLVMTLAILRPKRWLVAVFCAFLAAAPDLFSVVRFKRIVNHQDWQPSLYSKFASGIQWFERPIGGVVEICWFLGINLLIWQLLR